MKWVYNKEMNQVRGLDDGNCEVLKAIPYGGNEEEVNFNGQLIAAAPELYEVVCELLFCATVEMPIGLIEKATECIKKIEKANKKR